MKHENRSVPTAAIDPMRPGRNLAVQIPDGGAFNAVFDSSGEALIVIDPLGAIQKANRRARELLRLKDVPGRRAGLADFLAGPPADQLAFLWTDRDPPAHPQSLDASLAS